MTIQLPTKNWQSSVTSLEKWAVFLADTESISIFTVYIYICNYFHFYIYIHKLNFQMEDGSPGDLHNSVYRLVNAQKQKFVVCLFAGEETNGHYSLANGLN
jgi:hypothetical protein